MLPSTCFKPVCSLTRNVLPTHPSLSQEEDQANMEKVIVAVEDHSLDNEDRQGVKKEQAPSSFKEHVKGHKYKYAVLAAVAIVVAVCCALLIAYIRSRMAAPNALVSGNNALSYLLPFGAVTSSLRVIRH